MKISITQPVIKHRQRPHREGSSLLNSKELRVTKETREIANNGTTVAKTAQSYQAEKDTSRQSGCCLLVATASKGPIGSAETPWKQARCAGDITQTGGLSWMGAGGCRGGSSGLGVDLWQSG